MEIRSFDDRSSLRVKVDEEPKAEEPKTVRITLLRQVNLTVTASVTKNIYKFFGAGSTVSVDTRDAPELLSKVRGQSCCGGSSPQHYFVLADG